VLLLPFLQNEAFLENGYIILYKKVSGQRKKTAFKDHIKYFFLALISFLLSVWPINIVIKLMMFTDSY